ncbi:ABC transporter permease [Xanthomarina sp. F2636L]|uniref:ABC transporter permease n=1 Tax=Xanthomarina sp. F2636L TaxID=2996018 RepID=UPI00225E6427|nr:ABC transporter permease [Xanthomarina sp. F2636L]MCX7551468.1 ABC transporter permease [Xanthomarina sp. F2636L]
MNFHELDIKKFLPHRPPFLMVDHVLTIDDEHVSTSFTIKPECIFNDQGVFNEAGMIENAAQTCSSIVGKSYFDEGDLEGTSTKLIGFISAIKKITINSCAEVGATITTKAYIKSRLNTDQFTMCAIDCFISENGKELLSCEINLVIQELK